jgi:NDP-mannose synthase
MKVIILAGGKGTRLAPYTTVFPKPLVPLGDMPIIDILVRQLEHYGMNDIVISLGYLAELIQAYFSEDLMKGRSAKLSFVRERSPLGTVGALGLVPDLKETFMTINGDTLTTLDYRKAVAHHKKSGAMLTIVMQQRDVKIQLGVVEYDSDLRIRKMIEKPTYSFSVGTGICVCEPEICRYIKPGEKLDFPDLVERMLQNNDKIVGFPCEDYWLDLGTHVDYERAQAEFESLRSKILPE